MPAHHKLTVYFNAAGAYAGSSIQDLDDNGVPEAPRAIEQAEASAILGAATALAVTEAETKLAELAEAAAASSENVVQDEASLRA